MIFFYVYDILKKFIQKKISLKFNFYVYIFIVFIFKIKCLKKLYLIHFKDKKNLNLYGVSLYNVLLEKII